MAMKKTAIISLAGVFLMLLAAGCEDQSLTKDSSTYVGKTGTILGQEGPGSYTDHPNGGGRYLYPQIIFKEFIPKDDLYDWKTWAWRITWPDYGPGHDPNKVPTVLSISIMLIRQPRIIQYSHCTTIIR
jgi:hypothetical protein